MTTTGSSDGSRRYLGLLMVTAGALMIRLVVFWWSAGRFQPTGDGAYYQVIASRIARGLGYTWLWPDGAVTYAAHYPVGYPAALGVVYALVGTSPVWAVLFGVLVGTAGVAGVWLLAERLGGRRAGWLAGLLAALHPGMVMYTPALMTEQLTATLWVWAAWTLLISVRAPVVNTKSAQIMPSASTSSRIAAGQGDQTHEVSGQGPEASGFAPRARRSFGQWWWAGVSGVLLGLGVLTRTQTLLLLPLWAGVLLFKGADGRRRWRNAIVVTLVALAVAAPWALRNKVRMGAWGLSFNGGWNLLIGTNPDAKGTFAPLRVPSACVHVFDEAQKDRCFGQEALKIIAAHPGKWSSMVPEKLAATFDYCGAAGWYLHQSSPRHFPYRDKVRLGVVETVFERIVLLLALIATARWRGPHKKLRVAGALIAGATLLVHHAWPAYVLLPILLMLTGRPRRLPDQGLWLIALASASLALTHAIFFGSGRYAIPLFLLWLALAGAAATGRSARDQDAPAF